MEMLDEALKGNKRAGDRALMGLAPVASDAFSGAAQKIEEAAG